MAALVTCKYEEYPIKNEVTTVRTTFSPLEYMGANFRHSRTSNPEVNSLIWPKFELIREFMAVLATCKFDEDLIKIGGTIDRTRSNMGFFSTQGQVTLDVNSLMWLEVEFIRDFMAVLVTCKIEEDWIKSEVAVIWTTLSPL